MTVRNEGPFDARIVVVGEAPGADETARGRPFVGSSGQLLDRMLAEAGIARSEVYVANVCQERPPGNRIELWMPSTKEDREKAIAQGWPIVEGRPVHPYVARGHAKLREELALIQPKVVIALGNTALWSLTGLASVTKWRGSTLPATVGDHPYVCVPTYHPAAVLRQWNTRPCVVHDLRRAASVARGGLHIPEWDFQVRPSLSQVRTTLSMLHRKASEGPLTLSVDIETLAGHIACLGIAWDTLHALCIPFTKTDNPAGYWTEEEESEVVYGIYRILTHPNVRCIGQNFIYDTQYILRHWQFVPNFARDTMVGWHVLYPGMPKSLDYIASMTNEYYVYWKDDGKTWWTTEEVDEDKGWRYNCEDCVRTFECDTVIQDAVARLGLQGPHDFQQSLFGPVLRTMVRGVRVDTERRRQMLMELKHHAQVLLKEITFMAGKEINPKSPKQMQEFFYTEMGCAPIRNRKTKSLSCDDEALETIARREPWLAPITQRIAEYRSCETIASNALKASAISSWDGRIHCSYNVTGTVTFRFSSSTDAFGSGMNLQNITAGDKDD